MKKILSLLNVLTISGSAMPTTIAASPYQKEEHKIEKRQTPPSLQNIFLPKLIKNTNLGTIITNSEQNILDRVANLNRNVNRNDISIARLLSNQVQIVLRENLENNIFYGNNFIWVTFETEPGVEIQVGNSIFYYTSDNDHLKNISYSNNLASTSSGIRSISSLFNGHTSINLGIIPDNTEENIKKYLNKYIKENNIWQLDYQNYYLIFNSHSDGIIIPATNQLDGQLLITFVPERIHINTIITNTNLGTINSAPEIYERIHELNPLSRNIDFYINIESPNNRAIINLYTERLYFGNVTVTFTTNNHNIKKINELKNDNDSNTSSEETDNKDLTKPSNSQSQIAVTESKNKENIIKILDTNIKGDNFQGYNKFIGTGDGLYLKNDSTGEITKFFGLNFPIIKIELDYQNNVYVLNSTGEIYYFNLEENNITKLYNIKSHNLKKELNFYYNKDEKNVNLTFKASNNIKSFNTFNFNLGNINPLNYKYIKFLGTDINSDLTAITKWGSYTYTASENDFFSKPKNNLIKNIINNNINLSDYGILPTEVEHYTPITFQTIDTSYIFARMFAKQKFGINFYWYKGNYYLQLIFFHYLDWRGSLSSLDSVLKIGNGIKLYNE